MWLIYRISNDNVVEFDPSMIDDHIGFVYRITNKANGKKYIGKKLFKFKKTKQAKGKKKRVLVDSDWREYNGSNKELLEDIRLTNPKLDKRILLLCRSKGDMSYYEAKEQFACDALLRDDYYNEYVGCRIHRKHVKLIPPAVRV